MADRKYEPLTKCLCTNTWIKYIKSKGWSTDGLYKGIAFDEQYMCDVENWMPTDQVYKLCRNITSKFPENSDLFFDMGIWAAENKTVGAILTIVGSFISSAFVYDRMPRYIENFNKHRKIEIVEKSGNRAIINTYHMTEVKAIKEVCEWTRGLLAAAPCALKMPPAVVRETACECRGDPCCQYEITWVNRKSPLKRVWEKTLGQKHVIEEQRLALEENQNKLFERFEELQKAKNVLEDYAENLEIKVEERTKELRETQAKLIETEKRTLEHRITGGFAHEMRNALSGAQLEFKTILNYKNQGKTSTGMLKESATTLLKNISLLHEEYQIPREKIAALFLPQLKTIAEIADHLAEVHAGVSSDLDRGLSITNQIREYARMSEFKKGKEAVDLASLLKDYESRYSQDFKRIGITYTVEGLETAMVKADETHMNSIFSNLLLNAKDALDERDGEGKLIHIKIGAVDEAGTAGLKIQVEDNGPGIPEDKLTEIFEPFFSTKPTTGTGLGLGIVKRLVQLYDGKIEVESKVGEWTVFSVVLSRYMQTLPSNENEIRGVVK